MNVPNPSLSYLAVVLQGLAFVLLTSGLALTNISRSGVGMKRPTELDKRGVYINASQETGRPKRFILCPAQKVLEALEIGKPEACPCSGPLSLRIWQDGAQLGQDISSLWVGKLGARRLRNSCCSSSSSRRSSGLHCDESAMMRLMDHADECDWSRRSRGWV
jgi:hypothetical protein